MRRALFPVYALLLSSSVFAQQTPKDHLGLKPLTEMTAEDKYKGEDGTHPSDSGRKKVADMLLKFFTTDEGAKGWFLKAKK
ncbi:MAG: hypothetical protein AAB074_04425 [Planctomycetota bacterium]